VRAELLFALDGSLSCLRSRWFSFLSKSWSPRALGKDDLRRACQVVARFALQPYMGLSLSSTNFSAHVFFSLQHSHLSRYRYEAEPASSGQVIVATSLYSAGISTVDSQTMMQIYASAARLRSSGAHSCIRHESHWLWRATATSDRCLARLYSAVPRLMIFPVLSMFLCSQVDACSLKPSGTIPVFT
jgi:hypothetical protein